MDENKFKNLMLMAKSLQELEPERSDFWRGFQRGLRRLYHGESFGTESEHELYLTCAKGDYRKQLQTGYRAGYYYDHLTIEGAKDVQPLRKIIGLSVAEIAEITTVSPRTVEGWEQCKPMSKPALELIKKYLMI
jgi:hypothetical protein